MLVHSFSKEMGFSFKYIFDLLIINNLKQDFNMTFIRYFVVKMWNFIYLLIFAVSRQPFKISKIWKTWYQNTCKWDRFWWVFSNIHDRLVWEFKLFIFHEIEMKLVLELTICVFATWNKINPSMIQYSKNQQFLNTSITASEIPYPYYHLWDNKANIVTSSFNKQWALLMHWWQWQAAVEGSLWGDERAPDTPPAQHFEVELRQHWYDGWYKAKWFP